MSASEKTPVLYFDKTPYGEEKQRKKSNCKSAFAWIFILVLFVLLILLLIQIFYSPFDQEVRFWATHFEGPIDARPVSPRFNGFMPSQEEKANSADPWDIDILLDPEDLCSTRDAPDSELYATNPEVKLLMLVPSAVDHFEERRAIRNTWGSVAEKPHGPIRLAFVLGTTTNCTIDDRIQEESAEYQDIIQANFVDSYQQLTTKSIIMLKWVAMRCPHAQYFLKADDDTFVNLNNVAKILSYEPYISNDKFISGYIETTAQPQRIPEEDFYISIDDYPGEEYPPYASGSAYVMTIPTAIQLFQASQEVKPLLPEDDVFLTGLCAQHTGTPLIHEPSFAIKNPPDPPNWETFSPLTAVHGVTPDILEIVWNDMTRSDANSFQLMEATINATLLLKMKRSQ